MHNNFPHAFLFDMIRVKICNSVIMTISTYHFSNELKILRNVPLFQHIFVFIILDVEVLIYSYNNDVVIRLI